MANSVHVNVKVQSLVAKLKGFRAKFRDTLWRKLDYLSLIVQRAVKEDKLSGQVLHVRTGTLRRSINRRVEEYGGDLRAIVGTNVVYAPPHEFGFSGMVTVKAHLRRHKSGFVGQVKAHSQKMKLPERSFLRSTLKEYQPTIRDELRDAAMDVLKGGK